MIRAVPLRLHPHYQKMLDQLGSYLPHLIQEIDMPGYQILTQVAEDTLCRARDMQLSLRDLSLCTDISEEGLLILGRECQCEQQINLKSHQFSQLKLINWLLRDLHVIGYPQINPWLYQEGPRSVILSGTPMQLITQERFGLPLMCHLMNLVARSHTPEHKSIEHSNMATALRA